MKKKYIIDDIRQFSNELKTVYAKSPLEAVRQIYPYAQRVTQGGDIVVYGYSTNKSTGYYKTYCYEENELLKLGEKIRQVRELHGYVPFVYLMEEEKLYKKNMGVYNEQIKSKRIITRTAF